MMTLVVVVVVVVIVVMVVVVGDYLLVEALSMSYGRCST